MAVFRLWGVALRIFLTSDHHFHHRNIIDYCKRPFQTVEEMNARMIQAWNRTLGDDDVVYHLGDFGFGPFDGRKDVFGQLRGHKILIRGNHDYTAAQEFRVGWAAVLDGAHLQNKGLRFLLTHRPRKTLQEIGNADFVLHGHIHNGHATECEDVALPKQHVNVCVEMTDYAPQLFDTVVKRARKQVGW